LDNTIAGLEAFFCFKFTKNFLISSLKMGNVEMEPTKPESNGVPKTTDSSGKTDPLLVQVGTQKY
jgi:hypothetical protein